MNIQFSLTGGSIWYSWFNMVVPLESEGVRYSGIERFHGIPSHYYLWVTFIQISILHILGKFSMVEYSQFFCGLSDASFKGLFGSVFLN